MVTFQKKAIAVGVAALLTLGSTNLYAAEGAAGGEGASGGEGAGGAAGGISVGAAVTLGIVGLGLIAVAADDDRTIPIRPIIDPPIVPPTTTTTTTTATTTTGT